jgi:hypothetical protein
MISWQYGIMGPWKHQSLIKKLAQDKARAQCLHAEPIRLAGVRLEQERPSLTNQNFAR